MKRTASTGEDNGSVRQWNPLSRNCPRSPAIHRCPSPTFLPVKSLSGWPTRITFQTTPSYIFFPQPHMTPSFLPFPTSCGPHRVPLFSLHSPYFFFPFHFIFNKWILTHLKYNFWHNIIFWHKHDTFYIGWVKIIRI